MKAPAHSLLARARAYLQTHRVGHTALAVAPLAALPLAAGSARAQATFDSDPANTTVTSDFYDSDGDFIQENTSIQGSALSTSANGVTGATFSGSSTYAEEEGGFAGTVVSLNMFTISANGAGAFAPKSDFAQVHYDFTLAETEYSGGNSTSVTITGGALELTITTSAGSMSASVPINNGATRYTGTVDFAIPGADAGATFKTYSASLNVTYTFNDFDPETMLAVNIPAATSIDFTAVPEPSTWLILATGVIGTGFQLMRVRQRRPRPAPGA